MPNKPSPALESALKVLFVFSLVFFGIQATFSAALIERNSHDGYLFLSQSQRLTHEAKSHAPYVHTRPRTIVALMSGFELAYQKIAGEFPTLRAYAFLFISIALITILAWFFTARSLFGNSVGYLAASLLSAHYMMIYFSPFTVVDILATGLWGAFFFVVWNLFQTFERKTNREKTFHFYLMGVLGALIAMTKQHHFFMLPMFLACLFLARWIPSLKVPSLGPKPALSFLTYVLTIEFFERFFGSVTQGFFTTLKLYIPYARMYLNPAFIKKYDPWYIYVADLYAAMGPLICLLAVVSFLLVAKQFRQLLKRSEISGILLISIGLVAFFALFTQVIGSKEPRYMLPFLAGLFTAVSALAIKAAEALPQGAKKTYFFLWMFALVYPFAQSRTIHDDFLIHQLEIAQTPTQPYFNYLSEPTTTGMTCQFLSACSTRVKAVALDGPHYTYRLPQISSRVSKCHHVSQTLVELRKNLSAPGGDLPTPNTCFVAGHSFSGQEQVTVYKPIAWNIEKTQRDELRGSLHPAENLLCENAGADRLNCYTTRKFFPNLINLADSYRFHSKPYRCHAPCVDPLSLIPLG